jgi:hypothetical protein
MVGLVSCNPKELCVLPVSLLGACGVIKEFLCTLKDPIP